MDLVHVGVAVGIGFVLLLGFALTVARFLPPGRSGQGADRQQLKAEPKVSFTGAVVLRSSTGPR